jgi:hypothetical protein
MASEAARELLHQVEREDSWACQRGQPWRRTSPTLPKVFWPKATPALHGPKRLEMKSRAIALSLYESGLIETPASASTFAVSARIASQWK